MTASIDAPRSNRVIRIACFATVYVVLWAALWYAARIADESGASLWFLPAGLRYFVFMVFGGPAVLLELITIVIVNVLAIATTPTASFPSTYSEVGWFIYLCSASPLAHAAVVISLRRMLNRPVDFTKNRDVLYFFASAAFASLLGALAGVLLLTYGTTSPVDDPLSALGSWFTGDFIGIITLSPFLLLRAAPVVVAFINGNSWLRHTNFGPPSRINSVDIVAAITMTLAVLLIFGIQSWLQIDLQFPAITLLLILPLIWLSFQYGLQAIVLAIVLLDGMLVFAVIQLQQDNWVQQYQLVMILVTAVSLWLSGSVNARVDLMAQHAKLLQQEVEQQTESLRRLNQELKQSNDAATEANLEKSRFLSAASHDLRQPIHAVGMFVARLNYLNKDQDSKEILEKVNTAITEFQDLLDGLLDLSRLDHNSTNLEIRDFPVSSLFSDVDHVFFSQAALKRLKFRIRPSNVWLRSDLTILRRILLNLVSNALKNTSRGGLLIACRPAKSGEHVRIEVWDSGVGIDPTEQKNIFREFYQVGNQAQDRKIGQGLGLSIVERSCALLNVPIALNSTPGLGTRVSMLVPLGQVTHRSRLEANQFSSDLEVSTALNVLLIEDDSLSRDAVSGLLEQWGFQVIAMPRAELALDVIKTGAKVDFVISDFHLPGSMDGVDAIRAIRAGAGFVIPACVVTGNSDEPTRKKVSSEGLVLLNKPVRPAQLRSVMRYGLAVQSTTTDIPPNQ